jgi:ribokinase
VSDGFDVAVLGSLHHDLIVDAPRLPERGETLPGTSWRWACGGKGGNQAVAAAAMGARTAMVGRVGDDEFGRRLRAHLDANGVASGAVAVDRSAGSGISVAISEATGDYAAVIVSGVNQALDDADALRAAGMLRRGSVLVLQNEVPEAANRSAAVRARAAGARVVLNAAPARPFLTDLAGMVDLLVVNEVEARMLGGEAAALAELAQRLALRLRLTVVLTAGAAGALVAGPGGESFAVPGRRVEVVSTHGAGDMFVGAMAARLAAGDPLPLACEIANAAAALLVSRPPAVRRVPRLDEVSALRGGPG